MHIVINEYGEEVRGLKAILEEINRDRSGEFTPYTKHDWRDGAEFSNLKIIK